MESSLCKRLEVPILFGLATGLGSYITSFMPYEEIKSPTVKALYLGTCGFAGACIGEVLADVIRKLVERRSV